MHILGFANVIAMQQLYPPQSFMYALFMYAVDSYNANCVLFCLFYDTITISGLNSQDAQVHESQRIDISCFYESFNYRQYAKAHTIT